MLRALIILGVLLMAVGFGAAGWQYWQSLPEDEAAALSEIAPDAAALRQDWLISATGALVPQADVAAYLAQERFVPSRTVQIRREAALTDLLAEGEKLPDAVFLQVLADIRAPRVAEGLCEVLTRTIAADCVVNSARVTEGSVDPVAGTARFDLELVYRLKDGDSPLPDLAAHVLQTQRLQGDLDGVAGSVADALAAAITDVAIACTAEDKALSQLCRPLRLRLDWGPGRPAFYEAELGWLDPLPEGMVVAPPLDAAPGG